MIHLKRAFLQYNALSTVSPELFSLPALEELILIDNGIKNFPQAIRPGKQLQHISLGFNPITEAERARIRKLLPGVQVDFKSK
jgi:Leucine-rich repeat (LRR) protein